MECASDVVESFFPQVMKKLGAKRAKDGSLLLDVASFSKALGFTTKKPQGGGDDDDREGQKKDVEYEGVQVEVRKQLLRRPKALNVLRNEMEGMDKKKKGKLSREDVRYALDKADIDLGPK